MNNWLTTRQVGPAFVIVCCPIVQYAVRVLLLPVTTTVVAASRIVIHSVVCNASVSEMSVFVYLTMVVCCCSALLSVIAQIRLQISAS